MKRHIFFAALILSVFLLSGCVNSRIPEVAVPRPLYETYTVLSGTLPNSDSYVGTVASQTSTLVSSKLGGRVQELLVEEGTHVTKGEVLAYLDAEEATVASQSADYALSSLDLMESNTALMFDAQLVAMQKKVDQAKLAMDMAAVDITSDAVSPLGRKQIEQVQLAAETANIELEKTQLVLAAQEQQLYEHAISALQQTTMSLEDIGVFLDGLFGISSSKQTNRTYPVEFAVKNTAFRNEAKTQWRQLRLRYEAITSAMQELDLDLDVLSLSVQEKQKIYDLLLVIDPFLEDVITLLKTSYDAVDASVPSARLSQEAIETLKQQLLQYQQLLQSTLLSVEGDYVLGVRGSRQALDSFAEQSQMQLSLLEKKVQLSDASFVLTEQQLSQQATLAQQQYEEALAALEALQKQKEAQLSEIGAQKAQVLGHKHMADVQQGQAVVRAPFAGIISKKHVELGQFVSSGMPLYTLEDIDSLKVDIAVQEDRVGYIHVGDLVQVYIPSLEKIYSGQVLRISPIADVRSKRFPLELALLDPPQLMLGMYAQVSFLDVQTTGLVIPYHFVRYQYGHSFVLLHSGSRVVRQDVVLGDCVSDRCLVLSGLDLGVQIVKE